MFYPATQTKNSEEILESQPKLKNKIEPRGRRFGQTISFLIFEIWIFKFGLTSFLGGTKLLSKCDPLNDFLKPRVAYRLYVQCPIKYIFFQ